jgi:hypothetical protein
MFRSGLVRGSERIHVLNMFETDTVMARRIARTWSGGVLLLGALMLFVRATYGSDEGLDPAAIILGTWFLAFITHRFAMTCRPRRWPANTLARASLIVPSLGVLALLPLTIHLPFFALADSLDSFTEWVALSALFTAPTTITAGILISVRASHLAEGRPATGVLSPAGIYLIGIAATGPFLLLVLPGILIALTGLPFLALMEYQAKIVERERTIIEAGEIPAAIAQFRAAA